MKAPFFSRLCCKAGLAAIAACSLQSIHAQTTIKDMAGRSVTVPAKVERISGAWGQAHCGSLATCKPLTK